ncbi:glycosyltransferase family 4 protein [Acrocarpospora catenulata]|uniref:glycosyltransferase family 4 protein n=1 Tax=Acrocarpospora catenulata TaxID=2836182 RepID=UPI001BDAAD76|nr:glycosyltransferase family 4 protein [Acrocarpospora catenulata]
MRAVETSTSTTTTGRPGRALRIAMIGQRGLPATFGGIEHHVAQLGRRLAARGHEVTVFCRANYTGERLDQLDGMRLRHLPTLGTKHLDALTHSLTSTLAAAGRHDIVHYHALGPGLFAPVPRYLTRARVVQTIHGWDDLRAKWGGLAQRVLRAGRWMSERVPNAVIGVSREISDAYGDSATYISNGVERPPDDLGPEPVMARGLKPGGYVLFVGRLVPEKAVDLLLRTFSRLPGDVSLAVAGGSAFTEGYVTTLRELAARDPRIHLLGYVYGDDLAALYRHAAAYVQPSHLEGLPLALLEAASHGVPLIASGLGCHREIIATEGPGGRIFRPGDPAGLRDALTQVLGDLDRERAAALARRDDILRRYSWDRATDLTEELYLQLVR